MAAATILLLSSLQGQETLIESLQFERMAREVFMPTHVTNAGDGSGRLFVVKQTGQIHILEEEGLVDEPFLDLSSQVSCCSEQGLLSVAFHPDFETNGYFYVSYTDTHGDTVVSRFRVSGDPNVADASSEQVILLIPQPSASHNGGQLQFGPDGMLYVGVGDGGSNAAAARTPSSLLGSILRLDVNVPASYAVPPTNPFVSALNSRDEIWVYGLRNPWRFSFDRRTGDLFIGDVGRNLREEIDFQPADSVGGENYGWDLREGSLCMAGEQSCGNTPSLPPIIEYSHLDRNCSGSVTGGYRYRGRRYPQWDGVYFYSDYCTGRFYAAVETENGWKSIGYRETDFSVTSFGEDEEGELYFTDHKVGDVYRLTTDVPRPRLAALSPGLAAAGSSGMTITLAGSNFVPGSQILWDATSRPATYLDSRRLQVALTAGDLDDSRVVQVSVFNPGPGGGFSAALDFYVLAMPALDVALNEGGVVEAASSNPAAGLAPGSIASVYGANLALQAELSQIDPLPTSLGGAKLLFNGSVPAPFFYAGPRQQNIQMPWELAGLAQAELTSQVGNQISNSVTLALTPYSPGLYSLDSTGTGQGAILIAGEEPTLAAPEEAFEGARPARHGEVIAIFANGLGPVTNTPLTGSVTPARPASETLAEPVVTIGGVSVPVVFSGLSAGSVALYQVNVEVTDDVPAGDNVGLELEIEGRRSNTVTLAVAAERQLP